MAEDLRNRFLKIYSNIPIKVREEIILDLDESRGPITWNVAYVEVKNNTALSEEILRKLDQLNII